MDDVFRSILNQSLTGSVVILAICLARFPLRRAPKMISYCLWAVAGFRLAFPFSIESAFSLMPIAAKTIPTEIVYRAAPQVPSVAPVADAFLPAAPITPPTPGVHPIEIWTTIGLCVWLAGVLALTAYGIVSFLKLKRKMRGATPLGGNLYETDGPPFVLGLFAPKIYIPAGVTGEERRYIVLHERTHVRRRDPIIKFAAWCLVCIHWFNPLAWLAFHLMAQDMEMACDERVLKLLGGDIKKAYSRTLVAQATERRLPSGSPLAFGEGNVKRRIRNVLRFKRTSRALIALAVLFAVMLGVGCAVDRVGEATPEPTVSAIATAEPAPTAAPTAEPIAEVKTLSERYAEQMETGVYEPIVLTWEEAKILWPDRTFNDYAMVTAQKKVAEGAVLTWDELEAAYPKGFDFGVIYVRHNSAPKPGDAVPLRENMYTLVGIRAPGVAEIPQAERMVYRLSDDESTVLQNGDRPWVSQLVEPSITIGAWLGEELAYWEAQPSMTLAEMEAELECTDPACSFPAHELYFLGDKLDCGDPACEAGAHYGVYGDYPGEDDVRVPSLTLDWTEEETLSDGRTVYFVPKIPSNRSCSGGFQACFFERAGTETVHVLYPEIQESGAVVSDLWQCTKCGWRCYGASNYVPHEGYPT